MRSEVWVGTIEVSYFDAETTGTRKNAFTVVSAWATNAEDFRQKCERMLGSYGWKLLGVDKANPAPENYVFSDEVADMLERTRTNPNAIILWHLLHVPCDVNSINPCRVIGSWRLDLRTTLASRLLFCFVTG
ncbi:MAG TPA: hypothetical protein VGF61_23385 [Candidatus Acidoferrum sp.]|jgi:hypothetical protein